MAVSLLRLIRTIYRATQQNERRRPIAAVTQRVTTNVVAIRTEVSYQAAGTALSGSAWVVDGDTITIAGTRIRLAGIDAPELDHPFGRNAKSAMIALCRGQIVTARFVGELSYDRSVAVCTLPDGRDLAAELVKLGLALDWPKFSGGRYRHLEPPGTRRKLWRCDARQKGRLRT